ncbi:MAG: glycogen debranching enzyme family protein [Candidatus Riflebacteria bacterium]|nr:glycogen debranching enzyme family protein [Candidatus Riflebacteria bacterium]
MLDLDFRTDVLSDLSSSLSREWLETNGLGSFASCSLSGAMTRRYHGLLVCATVPPVGRLQLVSKVAETIRVGDTSFELDTNLYPGAVHPTGHRHAVEASVRPFPSFVFRAGGVRLEKTVFMPREHQATVCVYSVAEAPGPVLLQLRLLLGCRDFHALTSQNPALDPRPRHLGDGHLVFEPYPRVPPIHVYFDAGEFHPSPCWFRNLEYPVERQRGLPCHEDNWSPGSVVVPLGTGRSVGIIFSAGPFGRWTPGARAVEPDSGHDSAVEGRQTQPAPADPDARSLMRLELKRREKAAGPFAGKGGLLEALARASEHFLVRRGEGHSIIAGYPWFEDWGRDTFISLPGLTLTMEKPELAAEILAEFAGFLKGGLLPNRFPDFAETPDYNTVDAPLWFIHAAGRYLESTDDLEGLCVNFLPAMDAIVSAFRAGTDFGIKMDSDGLLAAGADGLQLTWMDAKVGGRVITPRRGKPVEIQALWYNALRTLEAIACELGQSSRARSLETLADRVRASFLAKFWDEERGCCRDVVDDPNLNGQSDPSLRPNQLFAASLPYPLLDAGAARRMTDVVRDKLLTPRGLRTLSPDDPRYVAHYRGGPESRDAAYHNGVVWPWLLGAYCDALVRAHGGWKPEVAKEVGALLRGLETHLAEAGLGFVAEIFEPEPPFEPAGCIAQAWSVAELLRVAAELDRHLVAGD